MNSPKDIYKLFRPIIRRWYLLAGCLFIGVFLSYRLHYYKNDKFQATSVIKLDNGSSGVSKLDLYENFDVFTNTNKTPNEIELLNSKSLISKTLLKLDFNISYYRKGRLKTIELYQDRPFTAEVLILDSLVCNKPIHITSTDGKYYDISYQVEGKQYTKKGSYDRWEIADFFKIKLTPNLSFFKDKSPEELLKGSFTIYFYDIDYLASTFSRENLFIRSPDEDVDVVRISYTHEIPEKAAKFVNAHAVTYIEDGVNFREQAAMKTVNFISEELEEVRKALISSEQALEEYKLNNLIIDTKQETDAGLKKVSQLELQKITLDLKERALIEIHDYLLNDKEGQVLAPNYESVLDPLFIDRLRTLNNYKLERRELLIKYKVTNDKIIILDDKIEGLKSYIIESIDNTKKGIQNERTQLGDKISQELKKFRTLPTKERSLVDLERRFRLNEKTYSFLAEKKVEAEISANATISFHRILSLDRLPLTRVTPARSFIVILFGFLSLIAGLAIVYGIDYMNPVITYREELETYTTTPVIGVIKKFGSNESEISSSFNTLATNLSLLDKIQAGTSISVTSTIADEGKSFIALNLAKSIARMGWKVLLVDFDLLKSGLHFKLNCPNTVGIADYFNGNATVEDMVMNTDVENLSFASSGAFSQGREILMFYHKKIELLNALKEQFEIIVFDTSPIGLAIDSIPLVSYSDLNLFVVRANHTNRRLLTQSDLMRDEYGIENMHIILNATTTETNYNGYYTGAYEYYPQKGVIANIIARLKRLVSRA